MSSLTPKIKLRTPTEHQNHAQSNPSGAKSIVIREKCFKYFSPSIGSFLWQVHKIIVRAGHKPWPRLFQNLRGSCETDWVGVHPAHEVASWLGHSPSIAARHYLKHKDLHVQAATGTGDWIQHKGIKKPAGASKKVSKISGAESGAF